MDAWATQVAVRPPRLPPAAAVTIQTPRSTRRRSCSIAVGEERVMMDWPDVVVLRLEDSPPGSAPDCLLLRSHQHPAVDERRNDFFAREAAFGEPCPVFGGRVG